MPFCISIGSGVSIRNFSQPGVSSSRLEGSEKKWKTVAGDAGSQVRTASRLTARRCGEVEKLSWGIIARGAAMFEYRDNWPGFQESSGMYITSDSGVSAPKALRTFWLNSMKPRRING